MLFLVMADDAAHVFTFVSDIVHRKPAGDVDRFSQRAWFSVAFDRLLKLEAKIFL